MSHIRVAGASFAIEHAVMVAYHCASEEADWNLELVRGGGGGGSAVGAVPVVEQVALEQSMIRKDRG